MKNKNKQEKSSFSTDKNGKFYFYSDEAVRKELRRPKKSWEIAGEEVTREEMKKEANYVKYFYVFVLFIIVLIIYSALSSKKPSSRGGIKYYDSSYENNEVDIPRHDVGSPYEW